MKRHPSIRAFQLAALCALSLFGLTTSAVSAQTQTDPYTPGSSGYDVSWPNSCSATVSGAAFGIVGVNHGRPFTFNSCFSNQYANAAANGSGSVYINTAYSGAYKRNITSTCSSLVSSTGLTGGSAQAWEIGCSEAETSFNAARTRLR